MEMSDFPSVLDSQEINDKKLVDSSKLFTKRALGFRNLQRLDKDFNKRKEKVLWPLFETKNKKNPW